MAREMAEVDNSLGCYGRFFSVAAITRTFLSHSCHYFCFVFLVYSVGTPAELWPFMLRIDDGAERTFPIAGSLVKNDSSFCRLLFADSADVHL